MSEKRVIIKGFSAWILMYAAPGGLKEDMEGFVTKAMIWFMKRVMKVRKAGNESQKK